MTCHFLIFLPFVHGDKPVVHPYPMDPPETDGLKTLEKN